MQRLSENNDLMRYKLAIGTLRPCVVRIGDAATPMFQQPFGRAAYSREEPILSDSLRKQGQAVCDALNAGEITEDEARQRLAQIHW
jgi:hypothetical protein